MEQIGDYLLTLVCGCIICGILTAVTGGTAGRGLQKMLCGAFVLILAISPLKKLDFDEISAEIETFSAAGESIARSGEKQASQVVLNIINETCASYILSKAGELGMELSVQVTTDPQTLLPRSVTLRGTVTPYAKQILTAYIAETLGIPKEVQQWITQ